MNTLLIGPRASGKTTIGRLLSARVGLPFIDLDQRALEQFPQRTVHEVWTTQGERAWRTAEAAALDDVLRVQDQIVALGGGTPIIPAAKARIVAEKSQGLSRVVYLRCPVSVLRQRLACELGDRPSLTGGDPVGEIARVLESREPTYLALADLTVDSGESSPDAIVEQIATNWSR
jgi:shikimate kinase